MIQMKRLNEVREVASEERAAKLEQKGFTRRAPPGSAARLTRGAAR